MLHPAFSSRRRVSVAHVTLTVLTSVGSQRCVGVPRAFSCSLHRKLASREVGPFRNYHERIHTSENATSVVGLWSAVDWTRRVVAARLRLRPGHRRLDDDGALRGLPGFERRHERSAHGRVRRAVRLAPVRLLVGSQTWPALLHLDMGPHDGSACQRAFRIRRWSPVRATGSQCDPTPC